MPLASDVNAAANPAYLYHREPHRTHTAPGFGWETARQSLVNSGGTLHSCLSNNANTEGSGQLNVRNLIVFGEFLPLFPTLVQNDLETSAAKFLSACLLSSKFILILDLLHSKLESDHSHQCVVFKYMYVFERDLFIDLTQLAVNSQGNNFPG